MENLTAYLYSILIVSIAAGAVNMLCPDKKDGGIKKYVRYVTGLAVTAALLYPLTSLTGDIDKIFSLPIKETVSYETEEIMDASLSVIQSAAGIICDELEKDIAQRYGETVSITLELDTSDISDVKITALYLEGGGILSGAYLEDMMGCPVYSVTEENDG